MENRAKGCAVHATTREGPGVILLDGDDIYDYAAGQVAVFSVDLPLACQVTRASHEKPYLTLKIDLSPERIVDSP